MTREEAVANLNMISVAFVEPVTKEQRKLIDDTFDMAIEALEQQKEGHWIQTNEFFINQDGQFIYQFICSECRSLSYFRKSNKKAIGANVCPNCGADMREGD